MKDQLRKEIFSVAKELWPDFGFEQDAVEVSLPPAHTGFDFASNLAMKLAGESSQNPRQLGQELLEGLEKADYFSENFEKIELAGPGFLNFKAKSELFWVELKKSFEQKEAYGKGALGQGKTVMVEFGQPNTHKAITVGHLRSAISGLAVARLFEASGYRVIQANYFGDVGMHVAKCTWAVKKAGLPGGFEAWEPVEKMTWIDQRYVEGAAAFKDDPEAENQIRAINKKIYAHSADESDQDIELYQKLRDWSVQYQDQFFAELGVNYDRQYPESEVFPEALEIVKKHKGDIFQESEGACIYQGEKDGLSTWVFLTSEGNPTYSAKDLALAKKKFSEYSELDLALVTTSVEQANYFKAVIKVLEKIEPKTKGKYRHLPFGWLLLNQKKTSSRMGGTVKASDVVAESQVAARGKISLEKNYSPEQKQKIVERVAMAGLKFLMLSCELHKNINYDPERFTDPKGFSGPFVLYTYVRTQSILSQIKEEPAWPDEGLSAKALQSSEEQDLLKLAALFPETVAQAASQTAPHLISGYVYELSQKFNHFYEKHSVLKADSPEKKQARLLLTGAVGQVLKNGLWLLGIETLDEM